jgi:hypothetical protein
VCKKTAQMIMLFELLAILIVVVVGVVLVQGARTQENTEAIRFGGREDLTAIVVADQSWCSFRMILHKRPEASIQLETLLPVEDSSYSVSCGDEPMGTSTTVQCSLYHFSARLHPAGEVSLARITGNLGAIEGLIEVTVYDPILGVPIGWDREHYEVFFE